MNEDKTYPVPEAVRQAAIYALGLRRAYRRGGTAVGIATARRLASEARLPYAFIRKISQYFPRHAGDNLRQRNPPSNGHIAWHLWGGTPGRRWSTQVVKKNEARHKTRPR